jgi:Sulfotransferase family
MFRREKGDARRQVILHYHIFKNAGTTVESILKDNFRARFARFDSDDYNSTISNDRLLEFLAGHPEVVAISSHHLRPPKPVDDRFVFHDMLFVRHPVARLWSIYEFYRRTDLETDPLAAVAKASSAQEFFQLLIDDYPFHSSNAQVNLLASAGGKLPSESDLPRAAEVIRQATALGVAELFDQSTVVAEICLGRAFRGLDFSYVAQNVTAGLPMSLDAQLARFQKHCGEDIFNRIVNLNQLDLALVQVAHEEVLRRFHLVPRHERRLKALRSRCVAREKAASRIIMASNHPTAFASFASLGSA